MPAFLAYALAQARLNRSSPPGLTPRSSGCYRGSSVRGGFAMATFLKRRIDKAITDANEAKVRQTVEAILEDVAARGDAAVRALSEKFDRWSPPNFRLSRGDLDAIVGKVSQATIADIEFAQAQIRGFA